MIKTELFTGIEKQLFRAIVEEVTEHHKIFVSVPDESLKHHLCDLLETTDGGHLHLVPGDSVLAWWTGVDGERPVIVGRIASENPAQKHESEQEITPHHLVIEAKEALTLKCGDGSITIRADGKVVIKGKDLVSNALRTNRIKGGSVSIN